MSETPPIVKLRRLFREIAPVLQQMDSFKQIADKFYEVGIIERPESPYGNYEGNKAEYVMDRLHMALTDGKDLEPFLRRTVPHTLMDADLEGVPAQGLKWAMEQMGYRLTQDGERHGFDEFDAPVDLPITKLAEPSSEQAARRIDIPGLSDDVQTLIDELEDNLDRGNRHAAALLTRKILHQAIFIGMSQHGKADKLKTSKGDDVELSVALGRCAQEFGINQQTMGRVTSAKWIGDSANHSYRMKVADGDLDKAVTGVRLLLQEIV